MSEIKMSFDIFEAIGATTSRTEKEELLKKGKNSNIFKELLYYTYNPFIMFFVKKDPKVKPTGAGVSPDRHHEFLVLLNRLNKREITGNEALNAVKKFFSSCSEVEYKWYLRIMQKDLKIGITNKTINKVYPGLIPTFDCQLAYPLKKFPKRFIVQRKLDGYRCLAFHYEDGRVELRTRNGNLIEGYTGIEEDVKKYLPVGYVYDGEIMARTGAFNDTQKSVFKKNTKKDGVLYMFDVVSIHEFEQGESTAILEERLDFLEELWFPVKQASSLKIVESSDFLYGEEGEQIAYELHSQFLLEGYEGSMVKDLDATYKCKRSYDVQKIKDMYEIDLVVVDIEEGKEGTKNEGTLGALVVELSDKDIKEQLPVDDPKHKKKLRYVEGCTARVNVGSGYSDELRNYFWNNKEDIINRTIQIQFQETTINEHEEHSLRFPIFVKVRDDK
jgi:ATP-dependent DNA ligase